MLILDEPMNGLDTGGIRWLRGLLRSMADEGRTVLLSSHVMSEMELVADHLLVIGAGRLLADEPVADFVARHSAPVVRVRSRELPALLGIIKAESEIRDGVGLVHGMPPREIARMAMTHGILLDELAPVHASVEDVFTRLVGQHEIRETA
ncbi:hypothetical protein [Nocardia sp. NPDC050435]|uniref:hypothetical protein n=1 Tax=Nocardia sp. NPDC050435 TaxID=3155040 RepID=UPI0033C70275